MDFPKSKVITVSNKQEWHSLLLKAGGADIYYYPEYLELYRDQGEPVLFAVETEENCLIYPFLKRSLMKLKIFADCSETEEFFDLTSPYGYGGHYTSAEGKEQSELIRTFGNEFNRYCRDNRVVSQFVRYHPLLDNQRYGRSLVDVYFDRPTVALDLEEGSEKIWNNLSRTTKNRVRKAIKSGLIFRRGSSENDWESFFTLYSRTMESKNAAVFYHFSRDFFNCLRKNLGEKVRLFLVEQNRKTLAAAIFLCSDQFMHYHLGGSDPEGLKFAPNNLLFFEAGVWGAKQGYSKLHLGGGYSSPSDQLFRFKQGFNKSAQYQFYLGKKINCPKLYSQLAVKSLDGEIGAVNGYFPLYRRQRNETNGGSSQKVD